MASQSGTNTEPVSYPLGDGEVEGTEYGEGRLFAFADEARTIIEELLPRTRLEVVGSVARGTAQPPYSDLDLLLLAPGGEGEVVRDGAPEIATRSGDLLTIFVDPFSSNGCFCSLYPAPLKVDWFVAEEGAAGRRYAWKGVTPGPVDPGGHPWDWIWWIWEGPHRQARAGGPGALQALAAPDLPQSFVEGVFIGGFRPGR